MYIHCDIYCSHLCPKPKHMEELWKLLLNKWIIKNFHTSLLLSKHQYRVTPQPLQNLLYSPLYLLRRLFFCFPMYFYDQFFSLSPLLSSSNHLSNAINLLGALHCLLQSYSLRVIPVNVMFHLSCLCWRNRKRRGGTWLWKYQTNIPGSCHTNVSKEELLTYLVNPFPSIVDFFF